LKEDSRGSKTLSQLRVEEVKTLPLAGYWTMLNTRPRGGEGGSIPWHFVCSIVEQSTWEWYFQSTTEGGRLCSSHTGHGVKGNSTEGASFSVLAFEEKRAEPPHLLAGFSPVLGFPGHIPRFFVDGVRVFVCALYFSHFSCFIHFKQKTVN
jgi:hypothetical protein